MLRANSPPARMAEAAAAAAGGDDDTAPGIRVDDAHAGDARAGRPLEVGAAAP